MGVDDTMKLVMPFKDKMFRYAYNIVKDQFLAEDVVQEALVKIWKKRDQLIEIEKKEAWCVTIARNLAIDKLRSAKKKRTTDITEQYGVSDNDPNPERKAILKDALAQVTEIMNTLPENQREIVYLRDVEGYTYAEIAEILDFSVDQVKVNLHRARKSLRQKLDHLKNAY